MRVTVYLPKNMLELERKIAALHAESVYQQVAKLTCPPEQKLEIIQGVQKKIKKLHKK